MKGKIWSTETIEKATETLLDEFPLPANVPGGMVRYRQALTVSFLLKAFLRISLESKLGQVSDTEKSAADVYHRAPVRYCIIFRFNFFFWSKKLLNPKD